MRHLDEHTMAFYAMGAELPTAEREATESHLNECCSCRAQVEELRGIDQHVAETIDSGGTSDILPSDALAPLPRPITRHRDASPLHVRTRSVTRVARFTALVRRHPVAMGSVGFVLAFLAFLSIDSISRWQREKDQPVFVRLNTLGTTIEVYGKHSKIFEIPVYAVGATPFGRQQLDNLSTQIADLDGNGTMEVVTGSPYREGGVDVSNVLRIFSHEGELLQTWSYNTPLKYAGVDYSGNFGIEGLIVWSGNGSGKKEILVGLCNARSPWCLMRLDNTGRVLGEYWHFGWLSYLLPYHLDGFDHDVLVLSGENDQEYRANGVYPVFTILDPARIVGKAQSGCAPGFGLPTSDAEIYYVRSGNVNPALLSGAKPENPSFGYFLKTGPDSSLDVCEGFSMPSDFPNVIYTFDNHLLLKDVWMSDGSRLDLLQEHLLNNTPAGFDEFTGDLKRKVRYWNGSQWMEEATRIARNPLPG